MAAAEKKPSRTSPGDSSRRATVLLPLREKDGELQALLGQREVESVDSPGEMVPFGGELLLFGGRVPAQQPPLQVALAEMGRSGLAVAPNTRLNGVMVFDRVQVTSSVTGMTYDVQSFVAWAGGACASAEIACGTRHPASFLRPQTTNSP